MPYWLASVVESAATIKREVESLIGRRDGGAKFRRRGHLVVVLMCLATQLEDLSGTQWPHNIGNNVKSVLKNCATKCLIKDHRKKSVDPIEDHH